MQTIYKYPFPIDAAFTLDLPLGARLLKAECQGGQPCLWAMVDPGREPAPYPFRLYGTGHAIDDADANRLSHVATFQQGPFVWHLFQDVAEWKPRR